MLYICYSCFSVFPGLFHPASRTEQKFIFKTETHKLTLHIKGMYLFFLQETRQSICLTLLLVYQTNHLKSELLQSRLEWLPGDHLGFVQGIGCPQGTRRKGNGEPSHVQNRSGSMASQRKTLLFKRPQWNQNGSLQCVLQDQGLYPQMCIHMALS